MMLLKTNNTANKDPRRMFGAGFFIGIAIGVSISVAVGYEIADSIVNDTKNAIEQDILLYVKKNDILLQHKNGVHFDIETLLSETIEKDQ